MIIHIADPTASFQNHFSMEANKRILFSGKFGSGKTYFLKKYFKEREATINTFWLSPVKYSVSLNEDVFEYIKFDLALRLISMPEFAPSLKKKFGEDIFIHQFLSNQPLVAIDTLAVIMETIATEAPESSLDKKAVVLFKAAKEIAKKLINSYKKYSEFKKKINEAAKTPSEVFKKYLEDSTLKKGSIFEDDLVTQTIRCALDICKVKSKKDNVLIIDDFDRLDPEHVFRILNILSVHNEMYDEENKFGFDKIIIVCDYDNIAKIYAHKYGNEISFSGYITKFFSVEVHHFNNLTAIQNFCRNELSVIINSRSAQEVMGLLLAYFVEKNLLTVRDIVKIDIPHSYNPIEYGPFKIWEVTPKEYRYDRISFRGDNFIGDKVEFFYVSSEDYPFIQAIRVLCVLFGDYVSLRESIKKIDSNKDGGYPIEYAQKIIKALMPLWYHANNFTEPGRLFFSYSGDSNAYHLTVDKPVVHFLNNNITLPTGWNSTNKYSGDVSYYKYVSSNLERIDFSKQDISTSESYKQLLQKLLQILDFLDYSGTLQKLGITKSSI